MYIASGDALLQCVLFSAGHAIAQAVSCWPLTIEAWVIQCWICGGQSGTGTDFSLSPSIICRQYHPTAAPYSLSYYLGDEQSSTET
jgi:hypothetical protein